MGFLCLQQCDWPTGGHLAAVREWICGVQLTNTHLAASVWWSGHLHWTVGTGT